jgi:hypothetical protein
MKFIEYLNEKYLLMVGSLIVFVNPDKKEIKETTDNSETTCRFVINFDKKKLYVWNAMAGIHQTVITELLYKNFLPSADMTGGLLTTCLPGYAYLKRGDNKLTYSRLIDGVRNDRNIFDRMLWINNGDDKWLNGYFTKPFIDYFKQLYNL